MRPVAQHLALKGQRLAQGVAQHPPESAARQPGLHLISRACVPATHDELARGRFTVAPFRRGHSDHGLSPRATKEHAHGVELLALMHGPRARLRVLTDSLRVAGHLSGLTGADLRRHDLSSSLPLSWQQRGPTGVLRPRQLDGPVRSPSRRYSTGLLRRALSQRQLWAPSGHGGGRIGGWRGEPLSLFAAIPRQRRDIGEPGSQLGRTRGGCAAAWRGPRPARCAGRLLMRLWGR
mmetsp:Transcript_95710/g.308978  ORF Transcript_95710/g.308978 Transcript_95710/m.308978 type:complete len:235 (-) Transcript_95710:534-1238(-)